MSQDSSQDAPTVVVVATREDGRWEVSGLPLRVGADLDDFLDTLRAQPSESGTLGLAAYGDDFFLVLRVWGGTARMLLSDGSAAQDWAIAEDVLDELDVPLPEDDDEEDDPSPVGDMDILADLGLRAFELNALCQDVDLYPDEALSAIAARLGFGPVFERALDTASR